MKVIITFIIMAWLHAVCKGNIDLLTFNPLEKEGYAVLKPWVHFQPERELSAAVADFYHDTWACSRVVLFMAKGVQLASVHVRCDTPTLDRGLFYTDDELWYYSAAYVKRIGPPVSKGEVTYKMVNVEKKSGKFKCIKSIFVINDLSPEPSVLISEHYGTHVSPDGAKADEECKNLVTPPLMLISPQDHSEEYIATKFGPAAYLDAMGLLAEIKLYRNGFVCFQALNFFSDDVPVASLMMTCAPQQGIVLRDGVFYYDHYLMVKPAGNGDNTFQVFINTSNKRSSSKISMTYTGDTSLKCLAMIIKINEHLERTEEVHEVTSTTNDHEHDLVQECKDLDEGNSQGKIVTEKDVKRLIGSLEGVYKPHVDLAAVRKIKGYNLVGRSDINLASQLGLVILFYERKGYSIFRYQDQRRKMVVVVAEGVVLTQIVLTQGGEEEDINFVENEVVYYNTDLVAWKNTDGTIQVTIKNQSKDCKEQIFGLEASSTGLTKKVLGSNTVTTDDETCKGLHEDPNDDPDAGREINIEK